MVELKSFLVILLVWIPDAKTFHHNHRQIMTPNNGQTGNTPLSEGNINEIAMFPPPSNNNLVPDSTESGSTCSGTQTPPPIPIFGNDVSVETSTTPAVFETVATIGGTVIKIELPSSINIFVNFTNSGQPTMEIPPIVTNVEISTDMSTVDASTVEVSTVSSTVEISTVGVSNADSSIDLTTIDSTSEMSSSLSTETSLSTLTSTEGSTVEMSTVGDTIPEEILTTSTVVMPITIEISMADSTTEISIADSTVVTLTADNTVETSTVDSTIDISIADSTVETSTADSNVVTSTVGNTVETSTAGSTMETSTVESNIEVLTRESVVDSSTVEIVTESSTNTENSFLTAPTINDSSTETMRYIQININLSDNNQNGNFGVTTQPSTGNLGQLQNKMIYKQKCDEYYATSRVGRAAKVTVFIVGGTNSMPKEFPHMAALGYGNDIKKEWLCGGSLISENYVITAAHCMTSKTLGNVQVVRLGTTLLSTETLNAEDYNVIRRIPNPGYSTDEQYDDIALLQLDRPVTFSEYVSPICLYSSDLTNEVLIATGWGKTEATGDVSPELQKVELEYFPNIECQNSYSGVSKEDLPRGIVAETQICAGSRTEEKDTCQGDSGGPLQIKENGRMYLVGVTSFGIACGQPGRPGVYTRVSYYIPWIEGIVWGSGR